MCSPCMALQASKETKRSLPRCTACCHFQTTPSHRKGGIHVCPDNGQHDKTKCPTKSPKHEKEDKSKAKAIKELTRGAIKTTSFKRHVEEFARKRGIDLTVDDTTVRTDVLQGLLKEVQKNDEAELIPKDMYVAYKEYRSKNQNTRLSQIKKQDTPFEEQKPVIKTEKKRKIICIDSEDDEETIDYDEEVRSIETNIASLKRKKQRLETAKDLHEEFNKRCEQFSHDSEDGNSDWRGDFFDDVEE